MSLVKCTLLLVLMIVTCTGTVMRAQAPAPQPQQQNEFIPLDQLPPQEQLPAPRLLIGAYSFVVAALFVYIMSVSRRLGAVRREVERLEADLKRSGPP